MSPQRHTLNGTSRWRGERRSADRDPSSQRTDEMHRGPLGVHLSSGPADAADESRAERSQVEVDGGVRRRRQALIQSCEASIRFGDLHDDTPPRRPRPSLQRRPRHITTAGIHWTESAVDVASVMTGSHSLLPARSTCSSLAFLPFILENRSTFFFNSFYTGFHKKQNPLLFHHTFTLTKMNSAKIAKNTRELLAVVNME